MCGITGWVDFSRDLKPERPVIEAMTSTMVNRRPDAGGVWCSAHAAIGHRRLSVIDLEGGEQPMRAALRRSAEAITSGPAPTPRSFFTPTCNGERTA